MNTDQIQTLFDQITQIMIQLLGISDQFLSLEVLFKIVYTILYVIVVYGY